MFIHVPKVCFMHSRAVHTFTNMTGFDFLAIDWSSETDENRSLFLFSHPGLSSPKQKKENIESFEVKPTQIPSSSSECAAVVRHRKDETSLHDNPRGALETLCKRNLFLKWPSFESGKTIQGGKHVWTSRACMEVCISGKPTRILNSEGRSVKKSKALYKCAASLLDEVEDIVSTYERETVSLQNELFPLNSDDEKLYSISDLIEHLQEQFSNFPSTEPGNSARKKLLEDLGPIRYSFPFMLYQGAKPN